MDAILRALLAEHFGVAAEELSPEASYSDLLSETLRNLAGDRRRPERRGIPLVRARILPAGEARALTVRAAGFSPYETQLIAEDALRAGPGARLAVELAGVLDPSACEALRAALAWLTRRGIQVRVRCDRDECGHGAPGAAA